MESKCTAYITNYNFICYFISGFVINDTLKYTYKQQQYKTCLNIINFLNYDKAVS